MSAQAATNSDLDILKLFGSNSRLGAAISIRRPLLPKSTGICLAPARQMVGAPTGFPNPVTALTGNQHLIFSFEIISSLVLKRMSAVMQIALVLSDNDDIAVCDQDVHRVTVLSFKFFH